MYGNKIGTVDLAGSVGVENGILCRDESIGYSGGPMKASKTVCPRFAGEELLVLEHSRADCCGADVNA